MGNQSGPEKCGGVPFLVGIVADKDIGDVYQRFKTQKRIAVIIVILAGVFHRRNPLQTLVFNETVLPVDPASKSVFGGEPFANGSVHTEGLAVGENL